MNPKYESANFFELIGQTIQSINDQGIVTNINTYRFVHHQDCCEHVDIYTTIGLPERLVGQVVTLAEEDNSEPKNFKGEYEEWSSHTWSDFFVEAGGQRVEFYFLGESNGYYGESVVFEKLKKTP